MKIHKLAENTEFAHALWKEFAEACDADNIEQLFDTVEQNLKSKKGKQQKKTKTFHPRTARVCRLLAAFSIHRRITFFYSTFDSKWDETVATHAAKEAREMEKKVEKAARDRELATLMIEQSGAGIYWKWIREGRGEQRDILLVMTIPLYCMRLTPKDQSASAYKVSFSLIKKDMKAKHKDCLKFLSIIVLNPIVENLRGLASRVSVVKESNIWAAEDVEQFIVPFGGVNLEKYQFKVLKGAYQPTPSNKPEDQHLFSLIAVRLDRIDNEESDDDEAEAAEAEDTPPRRESRRRNHSPSDSVPPSRKSTRISKQRNRGGEGRGAKGEKRARSSEMGGASEIIGAP
uniref:Uncharacterized protein n=1 Tax=Chromera velia CCMP2878 TaxID=1169474 RepID=A0A0G4HGY9_9ALVE|eukprot:Cvel_27452.t1-p1 / transcript=Cvel_27452.t1 / gene=Cvel_27452 / organism=Chromera_velia_CCMP2878 / gene_product=hypothetical protein / transcript_product=hypothetical protein / location=Cvel_scaffold3427:15762-16793(+) / protein_length=344 / sequence_SO=supercontig / SO=protein_coding / is_pseudo=false